MKYSLFLLFLCSCFAAKAPESELEKMSKDVLTDKDHEGIDIRITPIPPEPKASRPKVELLKH